MNNKRFQQAVKRAIDVSLSVVVLLVCLPLLGCIALLIHRRMGAPVIFRQRRPGLRERPFVLYKFRTMNDALGHDGKLLSDGERLTSLGRFLRRSSLDELPQLWNVLRGEMSLVGPRPLLKEYLPLYTTEQARRHEAKPGITGWAQINGRNAITWDDKFVLDVWYVDHGSLLLDMRILTATLRKVFCCKGISGASCATMSEFQGLPSPHSKKNPC